MAQSIEEIKAELEAPTHRVVNGEQVDLSAEEIEATLNTWAENERARQLDEEANGYKYARETAYPSLKEQLDKLYHDMKDGKLGVAATTGSWFVGITSVKTAIAKT